MKKKRRSEVVSLLQKRVGDHLWGVIVRAKLRPGQGKVPPDSQSSPFVISRNIGADRVVYGSVEALLREIHLTVLDLMDENRRWADATISSESDYTYARRVKNSLLALAVEARNLDDLLKRRGLGEIPCFGYDRKPIGNVPIRKVLDYLVHNRYVYVDSELIRDIFSDRSWSHAKVKSRFMGYSINWYELLNGILALTGSVTIGDVIELLSERLSRLNASTDHRDLVLLVQNVHALTAWLSGKQSDRRYGDLLPQLCGPMAQEHLSGLDPEAVGTHLYPEFAFRGGASIPTLKIAPKWTFGVAVQAKCRIRDGTGESVFEDSDFRTYKTELDHDAFLQVVDRTFGDDPILPPAQRLSLCMETV